MKNFKNFIVVALYFLPSIATLVICLMRGEGVWMSVLASIGILFVWGLLWAYGMTTAGVAKARKEENKEN